MTDSAAAAASSAAAAVHREGYTYGDALECWATDAVEDAETTETTVEEGMTTDIAWEVRKTTDTVREESETTDTVTYTCDEICFTCIFLK